MDELTTFRWPPCIGTSAAWHEGDRWSTYVCVVSQDVGAFSSLSSRMDAIAHPGIWCGARGRRQEAWRRCSDGTIAACPRWIHAGSREEGKPPHRRTQPPAGPAGRHIRGHWRGGRDGRATMEDLRRRRRLGSDRCCRAGPRRRRSGKRQGWWDGWARREARTCKQRSWLDMRRRLRRRGRAEAVGVQGRQRGGGCVETERGRQGRSGCGRGWDWAVFIGVRQRVFWKQKSW